MKKNIHIFLSMLIMLLPFSAKSFMLPPFKLDISVIGSEITSYVNTASSTASKYIQQSSIVQTAISYGQGAKEAYEFSQNMLNQLKNTDLTNLGDTLNQMSEVENQQIQSKVEAAMETATLSEETNAKIQEIDENISELRKKIIENPENFEEYQQKIDEYEEEKTKLSQDLIDQTNEINAEVTDQINKLSSQVSDLKGKAQGLVSSIIGISADYDSTEDLNKAAETLLPGEDVELNQKVVEAYVSQYKTSYYQTLVKAVGRSTLLKSTLSEDNEKASDEKVSSAELESLSGAVGTVVKTKAQNIKAFLNFTELLLQKIQLDIAKDLATENFGSSNAQQAAGAFNLDNYRYIPPEDTKEETSDVEESEELDKLDEEITSTSGAIFTEGADNLTTSDGEGG